MSDSLTSSLGLSDLRYLKRAAEIIDARITSMAASVSDPNARYAFSIDSATPQDQSGMEKDFDIVPTLRRLRAKGYIVKVNEFAGGWSFYVTRAGFRAVGL